jgi:putative ABC transport system ATP-binding protein
MDVADGSLIKAENLWKIYRLGKQDVKALQGVSFTVQLNEFLAIMGPSGSGKSTLMNLIGCLDTPSEGDYFLNGKLVSTMTENELAHIRNSEIGFVFQVFNLLPRATAFRNVELPLIYKGTKKHAREERSAGP